MSPQTWKIRLNEPGYWGFVCYFLSYDWSKSNNPVIDSWDYLQKMHHHRDQKLRAHHSTYIHSANQLSQNILLSLDLEAIFVACIWSYVGAVLHVP